MNFSISIDGQQLSLDSVDNWLKKGCPVVRLKPKAKAALKRSRKVVEELAAGEQPIYGINTGFGRLKSARIDSQDLEALQVNLLRSHAVGVGPALDRQTVKLMMLLRANSLAKGYSGCRPELVEQILSLLNADLVPWVPEQGSLGASGDLAPLAHLALPLIGEGYLNVGGQRKKAAPYLKRKKIAALKLQSKEGLALINGTQLMLALLAITWKQAELLARSADLVAAMSLEGLKGSLQPFAKKVHDLRPHPGQALVAGNIRRLLRGSAILKSHKDCDRVQDPYSLRCVPQVHGAVRDALDHVKNIIERELNSVTDNPLVFPDDKELISAGHFHGEPLALAADYLGIAVAELASISERRIEQMVNPDLSQMPGFLSEDGGLHSGYMIAQYTAASLVSENKSLAHPASVDSIPTSANQEDHVSMGPIACRQARAIVSNSFKVLALEAMCAAQALDFEDDYHPGVGVQAAHRLIRKKLPHLKEDRILADDLEKISPLLESGQLWASAGERCRSLK